MFKIEFHSYGESVLLKHIILDEDARVIQRQNIASQGGSTCLTCLVCGDVATGMLFGINIVYKFDLRDI